jgi:predicted DNA-binding transcriptional regulator AlpA
MEEREDLITVPEAARLRGVTESAMYALIKRGRLKAQEKYGVLLLSKAEVEGFVPEKPGPTGKKQEEGGNN